MGTRNISSRGDVQLTEMLRLFIFLAAAAAAAWMQTAALRPVKAASPTTLVELVSAIRVNAKALEGSSDVDHPKIYNFCKLVLPNNGVLSVANPVTAPYVQVYIDSPARTGQAQQRPAPGAKADRRRGTCRA